MIQIYRRYILIAQLFLVLFLASCKESEYPIPNVPVNQNINLDLPSYAPLNSPGGYVYVEGGSRGIIVYRNFDQFVALDRHSTYESYKECAIVEVNPDNTFELIDTCSGSTFSIISGVVLSGPAQFGLKRYNTYWDGAYTVNIYN
jgi:nitrite reductase/ring-hydroxylating ferredoxin subunit